MIHNYNTNPTSIIKITMACAGVLNKTTKEYPHIRIYIYIRMDRFHYFEKRSFCFKNNEEKLKTKQSFLKTISF